MRRPPVLLLGLLVSFALHCGAGNGGSTPAAGGAPGATGDPGTSSGPGAPPGADGGSGAAPDAAAGAEGGSPDAGARGSASVLQMHNHINRDGFFVDGALTAAALGAGTLHLDPAFTAKLSGNIFASPLYVESGVQGKGTFYVVTASNNVYAIDEATGKLALPVKNMGPTPTTYNGTVGPGGIVGTPAIDLATRLIVFDAKTAPSVHTIHALSIDDLSEKWSLDVSTMSDPVVGKFVPDAQSERSAVLIVGGVAYVAYGGYWGDGGNYHGWLVGVPLAGPAGAKAYATPDGQCGLWAAGGPSSDGTNIYVSTGNGAKQGATWQGEFAVMRFAPGPVFSNSPVDYWFNVNANGDQDLSGAQPLIIDAPSMTPSALVVQLGKDGNAYLLDRSNLKGSAAPLSSATIMGGSGEMANVPASATIPSGTYVATISNDGSQGSACPGGTTGDLVVFKLDPAAPNKVTVAWCADNKGGGSPSITTSDGAADAIVWTFGTDSKGGAKSGDSQLHAWDLATGKPIVTGSDTVANTRHFTTPIFVHGRVMIVGDGGLYAFKP